MVFYKVLQWLPEKAVMIEAGSYWGYYSLWFKKDRPSGSVYLIEPLDSHIEAGRINFDANQTHGEFFKAYIGSSSLPPHTVSMEGETVSDVERVTIDDFMERQKISHADILHVDVQGAEAELLRGADSVLSAGLVSYLFISTHGVRVHSDCLDLLAKYGLRIIASHTREESFTTDGLIVARNAKMDGLGDVTISKKKTGFLGDALAVLKYLHHSGQIGRKRSVSLI